MKYSSKSVDPIQHRLVEAAEAGKESFMGFLIGNHGVLNNTNYLMSRNGHSIEEVEELILEALDYLGGYQMGRDMRHMLKNVPLVRFGHKFRLASQVYDGGSYAVFSQLFGEESALPEVYCTRRRRGVLIHAGMPTSLGSAAVLKPCIERFAALHADGGRLRPAESREESLDLGRTLLRAAVDLTASEGAGDIKYFLPTFK